MQFPQPVKMKISEEQIKDINRMAREECSKGNQNYTCACGAPLEFTGLGFTCGNKIGLTTSQCFGDPLIKNEKPSKKIRLWRLGSLEHRVLPTKEVLDKFRQILKSALESNEESVDLIWGPDIDIKVVEVTPEIEDKLISIGESKVSQ